MVPASIRRIRHAECARQRRNLVLESMAEIGSITPEARDAASRAPLGVVPALTETGDAPYFVDLVKDSLLERFSEKDLTSSSLKVYTGLDLDFAEDCFACDSSRNQGSRHATGQAPEEGRPFSGAASGAGLSRSRTLARSWRCKADAATGVSQLNRAVARRQPGSGSPSAWTCSASSTSAADRCRPAAAWSSAITA